MDRVECPSETGSHARVGPAAESVVDRVCEEHEVESLRFLGVSRYLDGVSAGQLSSLCSSLSLALVWCSV